VTLLAASSLTVMAGATIAPALPSMAAHFHPQGASEAESARVEFLVRLALTGPGLFTAIVALMAGALIDRVGRFVPLVVGLVLYIAAGTSGLYVESLTALLIGRALLGVAVALVMVSSATIIGDLYSGPARQRFNGLQGTFMSLGGVVFLVLAGFLADVGWRAPFYIYFAAGAVLLGAAATLGSVRPTHPGEGQVGEADMLHRPTAVLVCMTAFVFMVFFYMIPTQLPFRLQELGIMERKWGGIAIAANGLIAGIVSANYRRVRSRLSFPRIVSLTAGCMAAGYMVIGFANSYAMILVGVVINGLGQGLSLPNSMNWMQALAPARLRGRLVGLLSSAFFLGQFASPIITKPIGDRLGIQGEFRMIAVVLALMSAGFFVANQRWVWKSSSGRP
jgi:MFS family permease